jgi:hypothetical protein
MHFCHEISSNLRGIGGAEEARREIAIRKPPTIDHAVVAGDRILSFRNR